jgi:hypothetical protein
MDRRRPRRRLGKRSLLAAASALAVLAAAPWAALAYDWQNGDVFVGQSNGHYFVYDNAGTLQETDLLQDTGAGFAVDCAFDRSGVLHTTAFGFNMVVRFLGPAPHAILPPDIAVGTGPESVSFARDGSFYVGHQTGPASLYHFTGAGTFIRTFSPANPATLLDLSADQRTMFYTSRSGGGFFQIHRYDVQTATDLSDFATLDNTHSIADFKLLPPGDGSGGAIVADSSIIDRVDGQGHVSQTYDLPSEESWFGIALDPDGRSFWAQTTDGVVVRFNIASGAVDRGPLPSAANSFGICVRGTRTAALDNAPPSIQIGTPAQGATFVQGQVVTASYSCTDPSFGGAAGTGVASCSGPVAPGQPIETGSVGGKTFTVNASDVAGNTASLTRTYTVVAADADGDGFPAGVDCNDHNKAIHPGAVDIPGNHIDENCDGKDAPRPRLRVGISANASPANPTGVRITRLLLGPVPSHTRIEIRCSGKGCPKRKVLHVTKAKARVSLLKYFKHRRLRPKVRIDLMLTRSRTIGNDWRITVGKHAIATPKRLCLVPGRKKASRCT